jgi:hypothetical protein
MMYVVHTNVGNNFIVLYANNETRSYYCYMLYYIIVRAYVYTRYIVLNCPTTIFPLQ